MALKAGEVRKTFSGWRYGTQGGDDIITSNIYPPIPLHEWDWCAYHERDVERSYWYGWGKTEAEALADLRRLDRERYEYEHETAQLEDQR